VLSILFHFKHPVVAYVFSLLSSSFTYFLHSFLQKRVLEGSYYAICDKYNYPSFVLSYVGSFYPPWFFALLNVPTICPNVLLQPSPGPHSRTFNVYLSSEVSTFQHHTKPRSKCTISLANAINTVGTSDITMSVHAGNNRIIGFWHITSHWQNMIPRWNTFYRSDSQETVKPAVGKTTYIIMQR